jgi:hypothetical protein
MPRSKQGKTREKIDVEALSRAVTNVLQNNTKIRTAARNLGVSNYFNEAFIKTQGYT